MYRRTFDPNSVSQRLTKMEDLLIMQLYAKDMMLGLAEVKETIQGAAALFAREPNLLYLEEPICIVGDIHGQLADLFKVFEIGGNVTDTKYIFLGDYVDRGPKGLEVILVLFSLKIQFPNQIFLLRGNHETRMATEQYGFRHECYQKYNDEIWGMIMETFDKIPLAAIINGHFFAVHGGIGPEMLKALELNKIDRFKEIPSSGTLTDMLWSDPKENTTGNWNPNDERCCSYVYGLPEVSNFLQANNLHTIIRAHQCIPEGYEVISWDQKFPMVVTIFSAENYCNLQNTGAMIKLAKGDMRVQQFDFSITSRDAIFEEYGQAFAFTVPFVEIYINEMILGFLEFTNDVLDPNNPDNLSQVDPADLMELGISPAVVNSLDINKLRLTTKEQNIEETKLVRRLSNTHLFENQKVIKKPEYFEDPDEVFNTVIERRRSDIFKEEAKKVHVNSDAVFAPKTTYTI